MVMLLMERPRVSGGAAGRENLAAVGERLRWARKKAGLSLDKVGVSLGLSRQSIWQWEAGQNYPSSDRLRELAEIYGVSIDWLLRGERARLGIAEGTAAYMRDEAPPTEEELRMAAAFIRLLRSHTPMRYDPTDEER